MNKTIKTAVVILAAGESKRMGQPKQLIVWQGKTLIRHVVEKSLQSDTDQTFVILGANAEKVRLEIEDSCVQTIMNEDWQQGLGCSIAVATKHIEQHYKGVDAILFCLVDQPLLTLEHFQKLTNAFREKRKGIVATSYGSINGVPAVFEKKYFKKLSALHGEKGAKSIIEKHLDDTSLILFEKGMIDLDTPHDLALFRRQEAEPDQN